MDKQEFNFEVEGTALYGWLMKPAGAGPHPVIVLAHGLSGIVDLDLAGYAERFVAGGYACFAYDHRNWGRSGGFPRGETDPWRQVADMRDAISFVRTLPEIDGERLGLWGTSYAGGHVLTVSALDRRVRCVVSQVPLTSGARTFETWVPADKRAAFLARLDADRDARRRGAPPAVTAAATKGSETAEWVARKDTEGRYRNELTLRSFDLLRSYEPERFIPSIAPTPLMMIIAGRDTTTPTAWQEAAFATGGEPKRLVTFDCRHYDVYMDLQDAAAEAALGWYRAHL
ncbi:MAG: alpha/beta fold hydrolase [Gammaproteobacteria bacterium]|nr:alpha/beta fold hydrolase [Gammaproteobacteria bacterium]